MTDHDVLTRLSTILSDLLSDDGFQLTMETRRPDVRGWDSFAYINFIVAVEQEFAVKFGVAEVESFETVGEIVQETTTNRPSEQLMLFNSYEFVLGFLPLVALLFYAIGSTSRTWALRWLTLSSIFFYAWWRPLNLLILGPSLLINYALGRTLLRLHAKGSAGMARAVLVAGIVFNVSMLAYFKYATFFVDVTNDVFGTMFVLERIILPLGISFITFQKIAFLIDVHGGRVKELSFQNYCLFVLFFPQLIAGPIVHYREIMPQIEGLSGRFNITNVSVGVTLFVLGLFKKVYLADGIAPLVSPIYEQAGSGASITLLSAWMAAVGFTLQIYFDFSGYTDMALGAARMFGIRLPPNFDSPLKASSIIEFWSRWHMTLTRFLTAYIYNPLVLSMTRRRFARGRSSRGPMGLGAFVELLVFPTLLTMLVSGLWHGAGYLFIVWGLLHGVFLIVNHAWRQFGPRARVKDGGHPVTGRLGGVLLTLTCVVVSMVIFRSPTVPTAAGVFAGMAGLHGVALPAEVLGRLGPLSSLLQQAGIASEASLDRSFLKLAVWIVGLAVVALACPNTLQLLRLNEPALNWEGSRSAESNRWTPLWQPNLVWAAALSAIAVLGVVRLGGPSEFLYWQF